MQPSTQLSTKTRLHSWPLAEWMVERTGSPRRGRERPARSEVAPGRVEGDLGQEALAARGAGGDRLELQEVGAADARRPRAAARGAARTRRAPRRARPATAAPRAGGGRARRSRPRPRRRGFGDRGVRRARGAGSALRAAASRAASAVAGPMPGMSCSVRKPAMRSRGFSAKRRQASTSLTCAASRNLSPPNLQERDVAAGELDLERVGVVRGAEEHRLRASARCRPRGRRGSRRRRSRPGPPRRRR